MKKNQSILTDLKFDDVNFSRVFDYWLGGYHNFEDDRLTANRIESIYPHIRMAAFANRSFLRRCIRFLCQHKIHQFIDIGSGIQTAGGVFEFLKRLDPEAKIILADVDPVVVQHNNAILRHENNVVNLHADARNADTIFSNYKVLKYFNFEQPVAVMLSNVLHYIDDDQQIFDLIAEIKSNICLHSFLVIEHLSLPDRLERLLHKTKSFDLPIRFKIKSRSFLNIYQFFRGFELVQPGLVYAPQWHAESKFDALVDSPELSISFAGVGVKKTEA